MTDLHQRRPLPDDIQGLSDSETACEYCGISYLLLTKYENMQAKTLELEQSLNELQDFKDERPSLISRMEILKEQLKNSVSTLTDFRLKLDTSTDLFDKNCRLLEDSQKNHLIYKTDMEERLKNITNKNKTLATKSTLLHTTLQKVSTTLRTERLNINQSNKQFLYDLQELRRSYVYAIQDITEKAHNTFGREVEKAKEDLEGSLRAEFREVEDALKKEKRVVDRDVNDLGGRLDGCLESLRIEIEKNQCLKIEAQSSNSTINELKTQIEELESLIKETKTTNINYQTNQNITLKKAQEEIDFKNIEITKQKKTINELNEKIKDGSKLLEGDDVAIKQMRVDLSASKELIQSLLDDLSISNKEISFLKTDKSKTVDAHQSRIKQLQAKFLEQLEEAKRGESQKTEELVKKQMLKEKEETLKKEIELLEISHKSAILELKNTIKSLTTQKSAIEASKTQSTLEIEGLKTTINTQKKALITLNSKLSSTISQIDNLNSEIDKISKEKTKLELDQHQTNQQQQRPDNQTIKYTQEIKTKDNEIQFLKNTVRIECEERMELIANLEMMTKKLASYTPPPTTVSKPLPSISTRPVTSKDARPVSATGVIARAVDQSGRGSVGTKVRKESGYSKNFV